VPTRAADHESTSTALMLNHDMLHRFINHLAKLDIVAKGILSGGSERRAEMMSQCRRRQVLFRCLLQSPMIFPGGESQ